MFPIEIADLKKSFGQSKALENVTFNVKQGEVFGFIGPNGAGKSTTIKIIMGLYSQDYGLANIMGYDCFKEGDKARENVGYLPSDLSLYPKLTVKKYLEYVAKLKGRGKERIHELANKFELNLNRKIGELSTGNLKKVGIVACVMASPKILIFDEPTSGLDPLMQQRFFEIIEEEKKKGASILMSSHQLAEIQRCCDRAGIIKQGKLITIKEVACLKQKLLKKVMFETKHDIGSINLAGVSELKVEGNRYSFIYEGDMKSLTDFVSVNYVENLSINDVNLDDQFIEYYNN